MKKIKRVLLILLVSVLLANSCMALMSRTIYAVENGEENESQKTTENQSEESTDDTELLKNIFGRATTPFEFNASELLKIYATKSVGKNFNLKYRYDINEGVLIPVKGHFNDGTLNQKDIYGSDNGKIDANDASWILALSQVSRNVGEINSDTWKGVENNLMSSLVDYLKEKGYNYSKSDMNLVVTITTPEIEEFEIYEYSFEITSEEGFTNKVKEDIKNAEKINAELNEELNDELIQQRVKAYITTKNGGKYELVVGNDDNFYLLQTSEPQSNFSTTMDYTAFAEKQEIQGKMDGSTYLPPYYDNDNNKKDADALVTIKSTTDEDIVKTNDVEMKTDGTANSEGWYYPDPTNKKVIAKEYPFDKYDNTTNNGMVNETVKLTGSYGGEDTQNPLIRWTFRRKNVTETENSDKSITVTITYNLPVDPASIPSDWEPVYDPDGTTIHKIKRTIKKGENYDKDVTVKQNGTDATNTTHISKVWSLPQAGESTLIAIMIAVIALFGITRRRKMSNKK